jgi:pimeloyl-ACP methyl ester carboxylesterase
LNTSANNENQNERRVTVLDGPVLLEGVLSGPKEAPGVVVFVYDRIAEQENILDSLATLAQANRQAGFATLTVNLLTPEDEALDRITAFFRENIEVLHQRVIGITDWLIDNSDSDFQGISMGYFGAGVSAAAILAAAAIRPDAIHAIVAIAPRTDLVSNSLPGVVSPTLFIAGEQDNSALDMSRQALPQLASDTTLDIVVDARKRGVPNTLETIPGVTSVFESEQALQKVGQLAAQWFTKYLL